MTNYLGFDVVLTCWRCGKKLDYGLMKFEKKDKYTTFPEGDILYIALEPCETCMQEASIIYHWLAQKEQDDK
jgi:hypothetical protein